MMVRNGMPRSVGLLLTSLCVQSWALATTMAAPAATVAAQPDPCRATVLRFERALSIMRETQGNKAGEELKEKLLPAKLQSEILLKDGYCGLARYIQEKKLDR